MINERCNPEAIDNRVLSLVRLCGRKGMTFDRVQEHCAESGIETRGAWALTHEEKGKGKIVLWVGLSDELFLSLTRLISSHQLHLHEVERSRYRAVPQNLPSSLPWRPAALCAELECLFK